VHVSGCRCCEMGRAHFDSSMYNIYVYAAALSPVRRVPVCACVGALILFDVLGNPCWSGRPIIAAITWDGVSDIFSGLCSECVVRWMGWMYSGSLWLGVWRFGWVFLRVSVARWVLWSRTFGVIALFCGRVGAAPRCSWCRMHRRVHGCHEKGDCEDSETVCPHF
jgi:hypothetical protein